MECGAGEGGREGGKEGGREREGGEERRIYSILHTGCDPFPCHCNVLHQTSWHAWV